MPEEIDKKIETNKEMSISPEREIVSEIKPEQMPLPKETPISTPIPTATTPLPASAKTDTQKIKTLDEKRQVKVLCDLAFQKGLDQAIKTAKSLGNAYVLDEFHDTLIDELRERLINKGELKAL